MEAVQKVVVNADKVCAIVELIKWRQAHGTSNSQRLRDSVIRWLKRRNVNATKVICDKRWVLTAFVTKEKMMALKSTYAAAFGTQGAAPAAHSSDQSKLNFVPAEETSCNHHFSEFYTASQKFQETIEKKVDKMAQEEPNVDIGDVVTKLGLARLNRSKVGKKATEIFKKKWPGRELAKRKRYQNGITIEENAWTESERPILELAAYSVFSAEQPGYSL